MNDEELPTKLREAFHRKRYGRGEYDPDFDLLDAAADEIDRLREALGELDVWSKAYPLSVFPEPDFAKARELLEAGGMTLDAVSASNMRHVVKRVGEIARAAINRR